MASGGRNARYLGDGILKSTDSGKTWFKLSATSYSTPQTFNHDFDYVYNMAIDTARNILYAAAFGEILKSTDEGANWSLHNNTHSSYTDIAITSTGVIYMYRSSDRNSKGIFRSTDGANYTDITPPSFPSTYYNMALGIDPNNENTVYIVGSTPGGGKNFASGDWASFWKYRYIGGNGSAKNGIWTDLSANLPTDTGQFGNFIVQNGYNLVIKVKPGDSNTVFLGATNLYRSSDGFKTANNYKLIGGYDITSSGPGFRTYPNHHPDQHALVFYPSNPDKMISACDGGIFRTENNKDTGIIKWIPLNHGYITTQFYTIAINHDSIGDNRIIGGLQDNGTYFSNDSSTKHPWNMIGSSDGSFCYIANNAQDYYISAQYGVIYRVQLNSNNTPYKWARLDPYNYNRQFVNPFAVDPNDNRRMYDVSGYSILWNNDITQYPLQSQISATSIASLGWNTLKNVDTTISAISVSTTPSDIVFTGTAHGTLYRIDRASGFSPVLTMITSPDFPRGNINNIAISPVNADNMIAVFSNYNIQSLFYTSDGGKNWTSISGNLEQFSDGSGNGPSCRWAGFVPVGNHMAYLVGTSTGLYSADSLDGDNTIWEQQAPGTIANNIVTMLDTRSSDGYVAVATYGGGIYSATINSLSQVAGIKETERSAIRYKSFKIYPDPLSENQTLHISFEDQKAEPVYIGVLNDEGKPVFGGHTEKTTIGINNFQLSLPLLPKGLYYLSIQSNELRLSKTLVMQ